MAELVAALPHLVGPRQDSKYIVRQEHKYRHSSSNVANTSLGGHVDKALPVQHLQHRLTFLDFQGSRGRRPWPWLSGRLRLSSPIDTSPRQLEGLSRADHPPRSW